MDRSESMLLFTYRIPPGVNSTWSDTVRAMRRLALLDGQSIGFDDASMPVTLSWEQVALRLLLTVVAGAAIGINRTERGRAAGLRTILLVCLAASISMIQANLLMNTVGKASNSFVVLDLMRLPLGILTGVGFIGAGAILRKGPMIKGLTTAATLWFVTVIGLCFGGGQLGLGAAATALGLIILWGLKWLEEHIRQELHAMLIVVATAEGPDPQQLQSTLESAGFSIRSSDVSFLHDPRRRRMRCQVDWRGCPDDRKLPPLIAELAERPGVLKLRWQPRNL
jgi:putative Mg2+ transporter-C (MgtC) family protein